jgi:transposase
VNPGLLHRWRQEFRPGSGKAFPGSGRRGAVPDRVAQLERKIGQQALEIDFLKGCLQSIEEQRQLQAGKPKPLSTGKSKSSEREGSR